MRLRFAQNLGDTAQQGARAALEVQTGIQDWAGWGRAQPVAASFLSAWSGPGVHEIPTPWRLGGVMVHPAKTILGIRAWNDAHEGLLSAAPEAGALFENDAPMPAPGVPFVLFDLEKIVRMMLHQSGLAFEILASPMVLLSESSAAAFPARDIIQAAITAEILEYYWDIARGSLWQMLEAGGQGVGMDDVNNAIRHALTGVLLSRGEVEFRLPTLLARCQVSCIAALAADLDSQAARDPGYLKELYAAVDDLIEKTRAEDCVLPVQPLDYDALNDLVVSLRQQEPA